METLELMTCHDPAWRLDSRIKDAQREGWKLIRITPNASGEDNFISHLVRLVKDAK